MSARFNLTGKLNASRTTASTSTTSEAHSISSRSVGQKPAELQQISSLNALKMQKRRFEARLTNCHKDLDPLTAWYEYVNWLEEKYDCKDESSGIKDIVGRCVGEFFQNTRYANDPRFLSIFLRYAQEICDPLEVFDVMFEQEMFVKMADFYTQWSFQYEAVSNYLKAMETLDLALKKKARPEKLILLAQKKLKEKIESQTINLTDSRAIETSIKNINERSSIKSLDVVGSRREASSRSLSRALERSSTKILETVSVKLSQSKVAFQIHEDNPENEPKLEKETNQKNVGTFAKSELEETKQIKKSAPKVVIFEELAPNQKFFADLRRIYSGQTEFSFEEIRYRKYMANKRRETERQRTESLSAEVQALREELRKKEDSAKNNELMQELETLKKQIAMLIDKRETGEKRGLDENDGIRSKVNTENAEKKAKLNDMPSPCKAITPKKQPLRTLKANERELSIVRDMWNGSIAHHSETSEDIRLNMPKKDFSIFKDPTQLNTSSLPSSQQSRPPSQENQMHFRDLSVHPSLNTTTQDAFTIALPQDESEFKARYASTPAPHKFRMG